MQGEAESWDCLALRGGSEGFINVYKHLMQGSKENQWYPVNRQEATGTNGNTRNFT